MSDIDYLLEDIADLEFRIVKAESSISALADQRLRESRTPEGLVEVERLRNKAEGLRLALSYMKEMPAYHRLLYRQRQPVPSEAGARQ